MVDQAIGCVGHGALDGGVLLEVTTHTAVVPHGGRCSRVPQATSQALALLPSCWDMSEMTAKSGEVAAWQCQGWHIQLPSWTYGVGGDLCMDPGGGGVNTDPRRMTPGTLVWLHSVFVVGGAGCCFYYNP